MSSNLMCATFEGFDNLVASVGMPRCNLKGRTSKHSQCIDIVEFAITLALETSPKICY